MSLILAGRHLAKPPNSKAVLLFFSFVFFAPVERKKDKHMSEKYYAVAGKNAPL
jgi:hypothetical protein